MSAQHTPGPWRLKPTTKRATKFFVVRDLLNERGQSVGLEFIQHPNGGARHFSDAKAAHAAIAKATGSAS